MTLTTPTPDDELSSSDTPSLAPKTTRKSFYEFRIRRVRRKAEADPEKADNPRTVAALFRALVKDEPREIFLCAHLDIRNRCIGTEIISIGTLSGVDVHPREVFRGALLSGAAAIVVGHNHPSEDLTPSPEDHALTHRIREAGVLLGIPLLDHIIITDTSYFSFSENE